MGGDEHKRIQWDRQIEFLLACVGYCIGYGDVWRYPYLCYKNGGGIGWAMVICSFLVMIYYNMILAWVLYYLVLSFRSDLLWTSCRNEWNTYRCHSNLETKACQKQFGTNYTFYNKTCLSPTELQQVNDSYTAFLSEKRRSPGEEFFENYILNISDGFHDFGGLQWKLVVALGAAWLLIFFSLIKGVKTSGKVVYFTATFPMVILVILFIRGVTLHGAGKGISVYMSIDLSRITEVNVWKDAVIQTFYSLGPAFGGLHTMASYNKFHNNCFRDSVLVCLINYGTSVFAGFSIFSIAGFMATYLDVPVKDVVRDGIGLAFIAYPEAIARMPLSPMWAVLFFFMLVTLGLDSMFATCETVTTAIQDQFPKLRKHTPWVVFFTCLFSFICGLPICTRAGMYCFTLLNDYSAGYPVMLLAFLEVATTVWIYGLINFLNDIQMMLGVQKGPVSKIVGPTGFYWQFMWMLISPVLLMLIAILSLVFYAPSSYGEYKFPFGPELVGWVISISSIIWVPIFAVYRICKNRMDGEPLSALFKPSIEWCPSEERHKRKQEARLREMQPYTIPADQRQSFPPHSTNTVAPYHTYAGHPVQNHQDPARGGWPGPYPGYMYPYPYTRPQGYYYAHPVYYPGRGGGYPPAAYFRPYWMDTAQREMTNDWR